MLHIWLIVMELKNSSSLSDLRFTISRASSFSWNLRRLRPIVARLFENISKNYWKQKVEKWDSKGKKELKKDINKTLIEASTIAASKEKSVWPTLYLGIIGNEWNENTKIKDANFDFKFNQFIASYWANTFSLVLLKYLKGQFNHL